MNIEEFTAWALLVGAEVEFEAHSGSDPLTKLIAGRRLSFFRLPHLRVDLYTTHQHHGHIYPIRHGEWVPLSEIQQIIAQQLKEKSDG